MTKNELLLKIKKLSKEIDDLKEVEANFERQNIVFNQAQSIAHLGTWSFDLLTEKMEFSDEIYKIFGVQNTSDFADKRSYDEYIHPEDRAKTQEAFEKSIKGELFKIVFRIIRPNGELRHILMEGGHLVRDDLNQNLKMIVGIAQDITEQVLSQEKLKESEEKAQALLNATVSLAVLLDAKGTILSINEAASEFFGKRIDDLIGTQIYAYFPLKLAKSRKNKVDKVVTEGRPLRFIDQGLGRFYEHSVYPVRGIHNKVKEIAVFIRDITRDKISEQKLREREKELEVKTRDLEEANTTLRVLFRRKAEDQSELEGKVVNIIRELIFPYLEELKNSKLEINQKKRVDIIEANLNNIISYFMEDLRSKFSNLTRTETQIANLIKQGKITKEIADLLNVSTRTIDCHRYKIRKKIGITNEKTNLRDYLLSRM